MPNPSLFPPQAPPSSPTSLSQGFTVESQSLGQGRGLVVTDRHFPLIRGALVLPRGALLDGIGRSGCHKLLGDLLFRGCDGYNRRQFSAALDNVSSELTVAVGYESIAIRFACLTRYLEPTLALLEQALRTAHLSDQERMALQGETLASYAAELDEDESVAELFWRRAYYLNHPLGRRITGEPEDLQAMDAQDLRHCRAQWTSQSCLMAMAGDVIPEQAWRHGQTLLEALDSPSHPAPKILHPPTPPGPWPDTQKPLHIWLVDKPDRVQVQMRLGFPGVAGTHAQANALWLAVLAFGGVFTSPLTTAIRDERGWSYIVHADFRRRSLFPAPIVARMAPALGDSVDCLILASGMLEAFAQGHITQPALAHARDYALQRYAFEIASGFDVLSHGIACQLLGEDANAWKNFPLWLKQVDLRTIPEQIHQLLGHQRPLALLVGPKDQLEPLLRKRLPHAIIQGVHFQDPYQAVHSPPA